MAAQTVTLYTCPSCKGSLDKEDVTGLYCPSCGPIASVAGSDITLGNLLRRYFQCKARTDKYGRVEINCPACNANVIVSDLTKCDVGCICCCECRVFGDNCVLCRTCSDALTEKAS